MFHAVLLHRMSAQMLPLLSAVLFKNKDIWFYGQQHETHPYYNLTVKVLRARNIRGIDLLSKANCYVALKLPAASPFTSRTQVVYNSSDPEWNESFEYRIHSAVKVSLYCGADQMPPAVRRSWHLRRKPVLL
uniref:C2 domain-containing protein n=1 Tax=Crocodylus porosus TaxID=8502 RepID=A0A7M4G317_CROPO